MNTWTKYMHKTRVNGQHIAAACGVLPTEHQASETTTFRLSPYMIAIITKHSLVAEQYIKYLYIEAEELDDIFYDLTRLLYANRSIEKPGFIEIRSKQIMEIIMC